MKKHYFSILPCFLVLFFANPIIAQVDMKALVPDAAATHTAVSSGSWFDNGTWDAGSIPGEGAIVIIPSGIAVNYSGSSDAHIFSIRVDGQFTCNASANTKLTFDTFFATHMSFVKFLANSSANNSIP